MNGRLEPIRIRIASTSPLSENVDVPARDAFWAPLRQIDTSENASIASLERRLYREFPRNLTRAQVNEIREEIRRFEDATLGPELDDIRYLLRDWIHFERKRDYPFTYSDPFTSFLDFRRRLVEEVPGYRDALERIQAASRIRFATGIRGYSSLELDLLPAPIDQVVKAFDANFDTFRVFLDGFVPVAFGETFTEDFTNQLSFGISIPRSFEDAFHAAAVAAPRVIENASSIGESRDVSAVKPKAIERAEWIWRIANGSLLVPVILSLIVLYIGWKEVSSLRMSQYEALKPALEHQLELLKEDRERIRQRSTATNQVTASTENASNSPSTPSSAP